MSKQQRPSSSLGQHERRQQRLQPGRERRQTVCTGPGSSPETGLSPCCCQQAGLSAGTSVPPCERLQELPPAPSCSPAVLERVPRDMSHAVHPVVLAGSCLGSSVTSFGWLLPYTAASGGLDEAQGCCEGESNVLGAAGGLGFTSFGNHPPQAAWSILRAREPGP